MITPQQQQQMNSLLGGMKQAGTLPQTSAVPSANNWYQGVKTGSFNGQPKAPINADTTNPDGTPKPSGGLIQSEVESGKDLYGAATANRAANQNVADLQQHSDDIEKLSEMRNKMAKEGKDTSHIDNTLHQFLTEAAQGKTSGFAGSENELGNIDPTANKSKEQIVGDFGGMATDALTAGGGVGAAAGGAAFGATHAMQENKGAGAVAGNALIGALAGKILETGFKAASPTIQAALTKYGTPLFEKLSKYIPEGSMNAMKELADKATIKTGNATLDADASSVLGKVNKVANKPFEMAGNKVAKMAGKDAAGIESRAIENATPKTEHMTPGEYGDAMRKGKIQPKTALNPDKYLMSDEEKAVATKYKETLQSKDPVKNGRAVAQKIGDLDSQVGDFLRTDTKPIDKESLRTQLQDKLKDVTDITVDKNRLEASKEELINNFLDDLGDNPTMEEVWNKRKEFDQKAEKMFSGSQTLAKSVKRNLRNGVQDFIGSNTENGVYKGYMKDMSGLYDILDTLETRGGKERGTNGIFKWLNDNPKLAKIIGYTATGLGGAKAYEIATH